jgi:hypothetical protein
VQDEYLEGSFPSFDHAMEHAVQFFLSEDDSWKLIDRYTWENAHGDILEILYEAVR